MSPSAGEWKEKLFMYDCELLLELLQKILWSTEQILKRIKSLHSAEDFLKDDAGLEKLDSICMQLIAIGEAIKQIDRLQVVHCFSFTQRWIGRVLKA